MPRFPVASRRLRRRRWCCRKAAAPAPPSRSRCNERRSNHSLTVVALTALLPQETPYPSRDRGTLWVRSGLTRGDPLNRSSCRVWTGFRAVLDEPPGTPSSARAAAIGEPMSILKRLLPSVLLSSSLVLAQGTINTYAGNDAIFAGAGRPATAAQLVNPSYMAFDAQGNLYFSATGLSMVLKVSAANGVISIVAGNGLSRYGGDGGLAVGASLGYPSGLALDPSGNLYIADSS